MLARVDHGTAVENLLATLSIVESLAGNNAVDFCSISMGSQILSDRSPTCENVLEGQLDVAGIEGRGLDEGKVVLAY